MPTPRRKFIVPFVRTDRVFMSITVSAKSELDARRIVEMMDPDKLETKAEFMGQDDGDYRVGDAVLVKKAAKLKVKI